MNQNLASGKDHVSAADLASGKDRLSASDLASGKDHGQENFPVASWLVRPDARAPILAYYKFARAADDISDHETATPETKLRLLAQMRAGLLGRVGGSESGNAAPEALALRAVAINRNLDLTHASDLLDAFEQDVTQLRYTDWHDLIAYCRKSAMPVGRWVLDVHGEDRATWPLSDALCAALQVINHLQDCGKDYRALNRVYIPEPQLAAANLTPEILGGPASPPELLAIIRDLTRQTRALLATSAPFASRIRDTRLACEVAVIQRLAEDLCRLLETRDPLVGGVHHTKPRAASLATGAILRTLTNRLFHHA